MTGARDEGSWLRDVILGGQDVCAFEARTSIGDWRKKGPQMAAIGLGAAVVGDLVGRLFGASA